MSSEAHLADDKCKKTMIDAARLADELRAEQDLAQSYERDRKLLECQVKDIQVRKLYNKYLLRWIRVFISKYDSKLTNTVLRVTKT